MKKIIFTVLLSSAFFISNAQSSYVHFPDSNAVWSVMNKKYYIKGDSLYNSLVYLKYFVETDSIFNPNIGSFFALLREDTLTEKVYAISKDSTQEHLLYDFAVNLNDTITVYPLSFAYYSDPITVRVVQIDSVLLNDGFYHKRIKVEGVYENTNMDEYWIAGVGSTFGIFNSGITGKVIADATYPALLCYEKDTTLVYDNPNFTDCYYTGLGIRPLSYNKIIKIFPNPSNQIFNIINADGFKQVPIITNILGQKIAVKFQKETDTKLKVDMSGFPKGIYFVHAGVKVKKIVLE